MFEDEAIQHPERRLSLTAVSQFVLRDNPDTKLYSYAYFQRKLAFRFVLSVTTRRLKEMLNATNRTTAVDGVILLETPPANFYRDVNHLSVLSIVFLAIPRTKELVNLTRSQKISCKNVLPKILPRSYEILEDQ